MINYVKGNLFESKAEAWTNTINCFGVMGKGIALEFKKRYPEMFEKYLIKCERKHIKPGYIWVWENINNNPKYIINFATKYHWKNPSRYCWIVDGLRSLKLDIMLYDIKSIAIPSLGCGNGGLKFEIVRELINEILSDIKDCEIIVYEP